MGTICTGHRGQVGYVESENNLPAVGPIHLFAWGETKGQIIHECKPKCLGVSDNRNCQI